MRWSPGAGTSVYRQPSNFTNGHTRDRQGRLLSCEHGGRRVTRTEYDGTITVLMDNFEGKRLTGLPMRLGAPLDELHGVARPDGTIGRVSGSLAGIPVRPRIYGNVMQALGVSSYSETFTRGSLLGRHERAHDGRLRHASRRSSSQADAARSGR